MSKLQKLELTWIGKGDEPKLEPRILIEDPEKSYWAGKEQGKPAPWKNNRQHQDAQDERMKQDKGKTSILKSSSPENRDSEN